MLLGSTKLVSSYRPFFKEYPLFSPLAVSHCWTELSSSIFTNSSSLISEPLVMILKAGEGKGKCLSSCLTQECLYRCDRMQMQLWLSKYTEKNLEELKSYSCQFLKSLLFLQLPSEADPVVVAHRWLFPRYCYTRSNPFLTRLSSQ